MKLKLTKAAIDRLAPKTRTDYVDTIDKGLTLRVSPTGSKTFYLLRRINGTLERIKIGDYPRTTVEQARRQAGLINAKIINGGNPGEAKRIIKGEPSFEEALSEYLARKTNRSGKPLADSTKSDYLCVLENHLSSIRKLKLSQVTPEVVRKLGISSDSQNNRAKAIIGAVFSWAESEGITSAPNPAKAIKGKFIKSRERFLQPDELPRFFSAVDASPLRDFFLLALFTGARRSNVQSMRWQDIDLNEAIWRIPKTKNGDALNVPLTPESLTILEARKKQKIVNAIWVFPGDGKTGHLVEPRKAWTAILYNAGIDELRIHDLRRTLGSWQARQGTSTAIIGKSLGHRSQQATAIYARLDIDPVRQSMEQATAGMIDAGGGGQ